MGVYNHNNYLQALFLTNLRAIPDSLTPFTSLTPQVRQQLELLMETESLPVQWEEFTSLSLTNGLFEAGFVGLGALEEKIDDMVIEKEGERGVGEEKREGGMVLVFSSLCDVPM